MQKSSTVVRKAWDWPAAILLFIMVQVAASRLVITGWTDYLYFTQTLSAFGVVLGLALGYSQFRPRAVRWMAWLYSLVILPWQLMAAIQAEAPVAERLGILGGRLWFALATFFARKPVEDELFFVALVALGFWIIGLTAGYAQTRHNNTLGALVPAGVATLIVQLYDGHETVRIWGLAVYAFLALVYVGRIYLRQNREAWHEQRVFVTAEATQDIGRSLLAVAAVTVFLAWSLPTSISSLKEAANGWEHMVRPVRERLNNAVSAIDSPYGSGGQGDFYSDNLLLGRNAATGDQMVFTVKQNEQLQNPPPRFYWRGHVYDTYQNGKWGNAGVIGRDFNPGIDKLAMPVTEGLHEEGLFTITMQFSRQGLLYAPSDPIWVNRPSRLYSTLTPGRGEDLSSWVADPALSGGDKYMVRSSIANPTEEELRAAGTEYPAWVKQRYGYFAASPNDPTLMTLSAMTAQVTMGMETPYDKAQALTAYLRKEIQYSTNVATPPKGVDPILWFLTDYKKGFCMYSASAEVLMLRSIGIPARLAVGFAQGTLDKDTGIYTVRKQDAHAWPEVYFPSIGWVEFEPTGNQDPLVRPAAPQPTPTPGDAAGLDGGLLNGQDPLDRQSRLNDEGVTSAVAAQQAAANYWLVSALLLLAAGVLLAANQRFGLFERLPGYLSDRYERSGLSVPPWVRRWERWMHLGSIERSFQAVNYSLYSLGKPQPVHATPLQRAQTLRTLLPAAGPLIDILLQEHQSSIYTVQPGRAGAARQAAWKLLGLTLWARIAKAWGDFDSRFNRYG